jgi:quercetin dioxygenase-like cupin family protein
VVYKGSIVIGTEEGTFELKEGDRLEIKAGTRHWARTQEGVCYVCGSK